jgi:pyruvate formate lyase activating enzyme
VNQVFFDVKTLDPEEHEAGTGVGNKRILENLRRLCEAFPTLPVTVRTPVIPGFNDSPDDIRAVSAFVRRLPGTVSYELLSFHRFGEGKYDQLGRVCPHKGLEPPAKEQMEGLRQLLSG